MAKRLFGLAGAELEELLGSFPRLAPEADVMPTVKDLETTLAVIQRKSP